MTPSNPPHIILHIIKTCFLISGLYGAEEDVHILDHTCTTDTRMIKKVNKSKNHSTLRASSAVFTRSPFLVTSWSSHSLYIPRLLLPQAVQRNETRVPVAGRALADPHMETAWALKGYRCLETPHPHMAPKGSKLPFSAGGKCEGTRLWWILGWWSNDGWKRALILQQNKHFAYV